MSIITLLTDFGTADGYAAEVKGVLVSVAPGATVMDLSHDLAPHDVEGARLAVARYWRRFPAGTVHLVVVDPGVGSSRAAIAVESDGRFLVGPDNGVLSPALLAPGARALVPTGISMPATIRSSASGITSPSRVTVSRTTVVVTPRMRLMVGLSLFSISSRTCCTASTSTTRSPSSA